MIGYVTLGTNDLPRAAVFYDAIGAELDTPRMMEFDGFIAWGRLEGEAAGIGLTKPFDGNPASVGNGVMVALEASSREQIHRLHDIALAHGGNIEPSKELYVGLANIVLFGLFISLYAVREGSLWGVCGWHAAWNWLLGLGFGLEVSGMKIDSLPLITDLTAAQGAAWWLTGAAFGPEASLVTTAVLLLGTIVLVVRGRTKNHGVEAASPAT